MSWIPASCALCGARAATKLFAIPSEAAPGGETHVVRCMTCGLRRLDPRPDAEAINDFYGSDYYTLEGRTRSPLKQALWDRLRDLSGRDGAPGLGGQVVSALAAPVARRVFDVNVVVGDPPPRVLDVGCGFGDLLIYLHQRGCDVLGVDFDPGAAAIGAEHDVPIAVGDLCDLELEPSSFDVVVMSHSLEHLADPLGALRRVAQLLRPGGTLHVAVPNGAAPGLDVQQSDWGALCYPVHFWYFDPFTLGSLLARAGFAVTWAASADIVHHHVVFWRRRIRAAPAPGGRELVSAVARRLRTPLSGDVLRVVARRAVSDRPPSAEGDLG